MRDIVLEKPINCSGSSWEAMWVPLCTSSSQMWLFPQCQIPWILAAEWVQNLTWSETCAYKNLLSLNSWCILGALMCKLHWDGWLASPLGLISTHKHRSQRGLACVPILLSNTVLTVPMFHVGRRCMRPAQSKPASCIQQLSSVNLRAGQVSETPWFLSQGKPWGVRQPLRAITHVPGITATSVFNWGQCWAETPSLMTFQLTLMWAARGLCWAPAPR